MELQQLKSTRLAPSLARLVNLLEQGIATHGKLSPLKAKEIVLQANVQVEDMMEYAAFNHPVEDCYGRKLVFDNGQFEVMVMSWNPGDYSSIHNHGYTQWGVVQVFGNTHHMIYRLKDNQMTFSKKELLNAGEAIKVNNALIHQMGNATTVPYLTLHVYGVNEEGKAITADAKNYDLELDRVVHTCGGAFFNLPKENVHDIEKGVIPCKKVFQHYAYLLMAYYNRQEPTPEIIERKRQLLNKMEQCFFSAS
ncbi:MAG: cysteine dioxygenase family protein [Bacteroidota bacterium]